MDKRLLSGKRQALDSVFVKANAAISGMVEREILEDASSYGKELDANRDQEDSSDEGTASGNGPASKKLPSAKPAKRTNQTHVSPSDPDACMSYKPGKVTKLNYLGQVSVDTAHHVITHIQAFRADKGDGQCLPELLENVAENLAHCGLEIKEVLADTGYSSEGSLLALAANNILGYIPNASGYKESREGFTYDVENDHYRCPEGKLLTFRHLRKKGDNTHKVYKTSVRDCADCPFKGTCANSVGYKTIEDSISKPLYDQMHQRMRTAKETQMRRLRSSTVEPVLGTLVNFTAMKQVNTKGLSRANKCMIMAAVAYNLKKLIKGTPARIRNRIKKASHSAKTYTGSILAYHRIPENVIGIFIARYKSKWLNNHLLRKFNYSAI